MGSAGIVRDIKAYLENVARRYESLPMDDGQQVMRASLIEPWIHSDEAVAARKRLETYFEVPKDIDVNHVFRLSSSPPTD